jgi:hypothetical protein
MIAAQQGAMVIHCPLRYVQHLMHAVLYERVPFFNSFHRLDHDFAGRPIDVMHPK